MNTAVTRGRGEMIVTTTGMGTEMGHIADLLNKTESDKTPLQKQLDRLTIIIAGLAGVAFILMVILGLRNGDSSRRSSSPALPWRSRPSPPACRRS